MMENKPMLKHCRIAQSYAPYDVVSIWALTHDVALRKMKKWYGCYGIVVTVDGKYTFRP